MRLASLVMVMVIGCMGSAEPAMAAAPAAASDWHATVREFAAKHFKNPAWGYSHCIRDYALARELAAADHVTLDDDVLFAAAYLHDMAAFKPWENEKLDHSDVAAGVVGTVLEGTGFALDWLGAIGVARVMALVDPNGGDPDGPKAVKMLEDNLKDVPGRVLSPAGRVQMAPRKAELEGFLEDLRRESDNLRTL
jgi:hypothetical protein